MTHLGCPWEYVRATKGLGNLGQAQVIAPAIASGGAIAFKYLVGSVLAGAGAAVVGSMLGGPDTKDSWAEREVFNARMRAMQTGFEMLQCEVGGAQAGHPYGCDDQGNCLCPGGTQPKCQLPAGKLNEWRALRNGFTAFYADVGGSDWFDSDWLTLDPNSNVVAEARSFARQLVRFFTQLPGVCPGYRLPFDMASIVAPE